MPPKKGGGGKGGGDAKAVAALINEGVKHQASGRLSEARAKFTSALALKPDSADAKYNMAVLILEEVEEQEEKGGGGDTIERVKEALGMLRGIISADTSGRGETSGLSHRVIAKTLTDYHAELVELDPSSGKRDTNKLISQAETHFEKARTILHSSRELDSIIFDHALFKKVQMSLFLASTETVVATTSATVASSSSSSPPSPPFRPAVTRTNAMLNKALDLLHAVSRTIEEALQTPYSSDVDLDCYRLHAETLDEFWDWFLLPSSIETLEKMMTPVEVERVSRIALDCSCRIALALTEMTSHDDAEFLAHRGDLYQAILRWHRSLRVRAGAGGASSSGLVTTSSSSCGSSKFESLCASLLRARIEAVLARNASTSRGMVDLADSLAFIVSEGTFMPELLKAFSPSADASSSSSSSSSSSPPGLGDAPPSSSSSSSSSSSKGAAGSSSSSSAAATSSGRKKAELMTTAHGCIQVALQLINTMAATSAVAVGTQAPPPLSAAELSGPQPSALLLRIAQRCYETAISLWRNGRMSRDEYVEYVHLPLSLSFPLPHSHPLLCLVFFLSLSLSFSLFLPLSPSFSFSSSASTLTWRTTTWRVCVGGSATRRGAAWP